MNLSYAKPRAERWNERMVDDEIEVKGRLGRSLLATYIITYIMKAPRISSIEFIIESQFCFLFTTMARYTFELRT